MATGLYTDSKEVLAQELDALQEYAKKAVVREHLLGAAEALEKDRLLQDYIALGASFGLTKKEMVKLLFRKVFAKPACNCPTCRTRRLLEEPAADPPQEF